MKKLLSMLMAGMLAVASLAGCGSQEAEGPVPKHSVYLDVTFDGNILLDRYDVAVEFDGERLATLENGENYTKLLEDVEEGKHKLKFVSTDNNSVSGSTKINVTKDMTYQCTIKSHSSSIALVDEGIMDGIAGAGLTMPDVIGKTLEDAEDILDQAGFINVESVAENASDSIWDSENWVIVAQSVDADSTIDKNEKILLTCRNKYDEEPEELSDTVAEVPADKREPESTESTDAVSDVNETASAGESAGKAASAGAGAAAGAVAGAAVASTVEDDAAKKAAEEQAAAQKAAEEEAAKQKAAEEAAAQQKAAEEAAAKKAAEEQATAAAAAASAAQAGTTSQDKNGTYVLNTNTMKFHKPSCPSVDQIYPENRQDYTGSRNALIDQGFSPCGKCHP